MQLSIWLATPDAASYFDPDRQSFADRQRWARMSAAARSRADWHVSRALLARVRTADCLTSLSHSGGFAALALAPAGARIGVDIELVDERRDVMRLARFAFAPDEVAQLEALPEDARSERFYALWALKEACVKAFGLPLLQGLRRCIFSCDGERWQGELPQRGWVAHVYRPRPALYLAALCLTGTPRWIEREWPEAAPAAWPLVLALAAQP